MKKTLFCSVLVLTGGALVFRASMIPFVVGNKIPGGMAFGGIMCCFAAVMVYLMGD